jgi:hypothetical protein
MRHVHTFLQIKFNSPEKGKGVLALEMRLGRLELLVGVVLQHQGLKHGVQQRYTIHIGAQSGVRGSSDA